MVSASINSRRTLKIYQAHERLAKKAMAGEHAVALRAPAAKLIGLIKARHLELKRDEEQLAALERLWDETERGFGTWG